MKTALVLKNRVSSVPLAITRDDGLVRFGRNYLFGLWAAKKLRMGGREALRYAASVARLGENAGGEEAVINTVRADIAAYDGDVGISLLRRRLLCCAEAAEREYAGRRFAEIQPVAA